MTTQEKQICPVCGCAIEDSAYELEGVLYCCQPCAEGGKDQCQCGCCEVDVIEDDT